MSNSLLGFIVEYAPYYSLAFTSCSPFARIQVESSDSGYRGVGYTLSCRPAPSYLSNDAGIFTDVVLLLSLEGPTVSPAVSYARWWLEKCNALPVCLSSRSLCYAVDLGALFPDEKMRLVGVDLDMCTHLQSLYLPASAATQLVALSLEQCESLRDVRIRGGATALRGLTHLNVSWCSALRQYHWMFGSPLLHQLRAHQSHCAEATAEGGWQVPPSLYEMHVRVGKDTHLKCLNSKQNTVHRLEVEGLSAPSLSPGCFRSLRELRHLRLAEITLPSVAFVEHLPHLQSISLINCKALDDIAALGTLPNLRCLRIACVVSCLSFRWMSATNVQYLEELDVNSRACGSGVDLSVLGEIRPTSLRSLSATLADGKVDWLRELFSVESLSLEGSYGTVDSMAAAAEMPLLRHFNISKCRGSNVDWLQSAAQLKSLKMRGCKGVRDFAAIGHLRYLEKLDLSENTLTDVTFLSPCTQLRELNVAHCVPGDGAAPLPTTEGPDGPCFPQLESLTLANSTCPWAHWIFVNAPHLRQMDAMWAKQLPSLAAAPPHRSLERLLLTRTPCNAEAWQWLGDCHALQLFSLRGCAFSGSLLASLAGLTEVEVSSCGDMTHLEWLAASVPRLRKLVLSNCKKLANVNVLRGAALLVELDLSGTAVRDLEWLRAGPGAAQPAPAPVCGALCQLALNSTSIADLSALAYCSRLQELRMHSCTAVTDFLVLSRIPTILNLDVSGTTMQDLCWVSEKLLLHTINIGLCPLRDISAFAKLPYLQNIFAENCAVRSLDVLKRCPQLQMVDVRGCAHILNYANDIKGFKGNILSYFNVM